MDMSVNPDGMDSTDYSDFEYQQLYYRHRNEELSGDDASSALNFTTSPLEGIGGLDNNEVAELVHLEAQITVQHDQGTDDQDVGSETKFDGVIGANLPNSSDLLPGIGTDPNFTVINSNNTSPTGLGSVDSEDRVFAPFTVVKHPAFDDQTNGPGGAGGAQTITVKRPFRQMVGRGPVLDSSDDIAMTSNLRQEDEVLDAEGNVNIYCVWDVAETSDAGRAFSVPR